MLAPLCTVPALAEDADATSADFGLAVLAGSCSSRNSGVRVRCQASQPAPARAMSSTGTATRGQRGERAGSDATSG